MEQSTDTCVMMIIHIEEEESYIIELGKVVKETAAKFVLWV